MGTIGLEKQTEPECRLCTLNLCRDSPNEQVGRICHVWGTARITGGFPNEFPLRVDGLVKDM